MYFKPGTPGVKTKCYLVLMCWSGIIERNSLFLTFKVVEILSYYLFNVIIIIMQKQRIFVNAG